LSAIFMAIHLGIASVTSTPEIELEKEESDKLAAASVAVASHYNIEASEKALAWTNLCVVGFLTYGPRVFAIRIRKQTAAEDAAREQTARDHASVTGGPVRIVQ
jgi:hypothetical protein